MHITIRRGSQELEVYVDYDEEPDVNAALMDVLGVVVDGEKVADFELTDAEEDEVCKKARQFFHEHLDDD